MLNCLLSFIVSTIILGKYLKALYSYKIVCNKHWRVDQNVGRKHSQRGLKAEKPDTMLIVVFLHLFS